MTRQVRSSTGAAYDLGYHVVWCPKYRRPVLGGRVKDRLEELIRAKADERGRQIVAFEVMPEHVRLLVCRWDSQPEHLSATFVRLQGVGHVRVHRHRAVRGTVKTVGVKREGHRWCVVLSCDEVPAEPLPATGAAVGIDLGVASLVTTSDGDHLDNPRHLVASADRLAAAQRDLARKKRGSARRRKAVAHVAALHGKVRRQRLDGAHKAALHLVRHYDVIAHEDLRIANMTRSASGTVQTPGTNVAQKSGLNRGILDAGWGVLLTILADKAESAGREAIAVNPANTSRTCAACGHVAKDNRVTQAGFHCQRCAHTAHADVNAAINIFRAGLALRDVAQAASEKPLPSRSGGVTRRKP